MSNEIKLKGFANEEEFMGNAEAVKLYGTWDNYNAINEIFSVNNATPQNTQSSPYDAYMQTATDVYNKGVEQNNNASANQAAAAGAEYRELNRNVNEINKANGRANTGYAGDTSIDGYNAYRNSLNEIYSQRDKANNDLYSYYMNSMMQIQQAKDAKEASDRDYEFQQEQFEYGKEQFEYGKEHDAKLEANTVLEKISGILDVEEAYDHAGNLKGEYADRVMNYLVDYYGSSEDIPNSITSELNTYPGWSEYLNAYNSEDSTPYSNTYYEVNKLANIDGKNASVMDITTDYDYWHEEGNNTIVKFNNEEYYIETGKTIKDANLSNKLKNIIESVYGREVQHGDVIYYDGKIYAVCDDLEIRPLRTREISYKEDMNNLIKAVENKLGITTNNQQGNFNPGYNTKKGKFKYK